MSSIRCGYGWQHFSSPPLKPPRRHPPLAIDRSTPWHPPPEAGVFRAYITSPQKQAPRDPQEGIARTVTFRDIL